MRERCGRVASADYRDDARLSCERLAHAHRTFGEGRYFEKSEWTVPYDSIGARDFRDKRGGGLRSNVETHHLGRNFSDCMRRGAGFRSGCDDMVRRQKDLDAFALGLGQQLLRQLDFVVLDARLADRDSPEP